MGQDRTSWDIPGTFGTWDYGFVYVGQLEIVRGNPGHVSLSEFVLPDVLAFTSRLSSVVAA